MREIRTSECRAVQMSIRFDSSTIRLDSPNYGSQTLYKISATQISLAMGAGESRGSQRNGR